MVVWGAFPFVHEKDKKETSITEYKDHLIFFINYCLSGNNILFLSQLIIRAGINYVQKLLLHGF